MGDENDISYLLKTHNPRIVVDEHGGESAKCYHFLDRASFSQWVESFAGRTRSHPRLPRWIRHKTSLVVRTVRQPICHFPLPLCSQRNFQITVLPQAQAPVGQYTSPSQ